MVNQESAWLSRRTAGLLALSAVLLLIPAPAPAQPEAAAPMSLADSVQYALERHPDIRGAQSGVRESRFLLRQRRGERRPTFGLTGTFVRQGPIVPSFTEGASPIVPEERYNAALGFRMPLFDGGLRQANLHGARISVSAQSEAFEQLRDDITLDVSAAYYNVLRAQALLQVADARLASAREQLRVAQARFRADIAPRFDVVRAETEVRNAESDVLVARNGVALAETIFNHALGRDASAPVNIVPVSDTPVVDVSLGTALEAAYQQRPRLLERALRLEAAGYDARATRSQNKMAIDWIAQYDRRTATGLNSGFTWNIGVVASFPFFDSGVTRSRVRQAEERIEQERAAGERDRQRVELQVRQALLNLSNAQDRIASADQELRLAQESLRIANVRYNAGVGIPVEVTDAQLAVARAATNLAHGKFDLLVAVALLEYATGTPVAALQANGPGARGSLSLATDRRDLRREIRDAGDSPPTNR